MVNEGLSFTLKPGTIHLWLIEIDDQPHDVFPLENLLSPEETERSRRFHFEEDRIRFVIRRCILRHLISRYTGVAPAKVNYFTNPFGKLSLPTQALQFSVSYSHNRIAYAFTMEQDVGVDIEQVKPIPDLAQLAKTWFSLEECTEIFSLNFSDQLESFYHVWTQKEAFIKVNGDGLSYPLRDFSVSVDPYSNGKLISIKNDDPSQWQMVTYVPEPGWRLAACVRSKRLPIVEHNNTSLQDYYSQYVDSYL